MKKTTSILVIIGICFVFQAAHAQTWLQTKRLTWTLDGLSWGPDLAVDATNNIHVVWYEYDTVDSLESIDYKRSTDGGTTWTATKALVSDAPGNLGTPVIASDSNNIIYVAWNKWIGGANFDIYYKRSTDGGITWSASKRLTWTSGSSGSPCIAIDSSNTIHIVWTDDTPGNGEIYYKKSTNGGSTWMTKRLTWNSGFSSKPHIAVDSSNSICIVWQDDESGNTEIYYKRSTDGGTSWTTKRLTWNSGDSLDPIIAADSGGNIHIVWHDHSPGDGEIYYKKSTNGGAAWTSKRLTWNSENSGVPDLTIDTSDNLHIVWQNEVSGIYNVFFKRSTNAGTTWTSKRLTWNAGDSSVPRLATDTNDDILVVWSDSTPGNNELFYRRANQ